MANSRPRSSSPRRPGARLWLGLLLAAAWSTLQAAPEPARRAPPMAGGNAQPSAPPPPPPPPDPARLAERRAELRLAASRRGPGQPSGIVLPVLGQGGASTAPATPPPAAAASADAPADDGAADSSADALGALIPEAGPAAPGTAPPPPPTSADVGRPRPAPPARPAAPTVPASSAAAAKSVLPPERPLRRDPVEPPLHDPGDAWRELLLSVTLNGRLVSQGTLFAENPADGGLAVQLATLELWRVRTDPGRVVTFQGEPYYPLGAIEGAAWSVDREGLSAKVDIPPERFALTRLDDDGREPSPPPSAGAGGFFDYDLLLSAGEGIQRRLDGLAEAGAFARFGTLTTSVRLGDLAREAEVARLDTTFTRDLPGRRATLRLGDGIAAGGAFAAPVRFAGLQYATNFGTDPAFVTFPLPAIGGLADQDSVVDVLIDNLARISGEVPSGPFAVDNLPVVTGAGEVQLRVRDLLGRERLVTQPYYVSSRLLKAGLHDFSYELGLEREDYGSASLGYGDPLAATTHRYGLSERLTAEGHLEASPDVQGAAAGGSYLLPGRRGVLSAGLGASHAGGEAGLMGELGYEYDGRIFNLGLRSRLTSEGFEQVGGPDEVSRTDQLSFGIGLGPLGRLGFLALNRESHNDDLEDVSTVAATLSRQLGPGAFTFRAAQFVRPEAELALTATYTLPLGPTRNLSTELDAAGDDRRRARMQYRQTRGASDLGLDYRLGAEVGTAGDGAGHGGGADLGLDARASYQTRVGTGDLELERVDGEERLRAGVSGSVALLDGKVALSRRIGRAFGLVALPGHPDVRVYLDNREAGRTDGAGYLLLPDLRPYEPNKVRVEALDLPLDAVLDTSEALAVPFDRSGVTVAFPVSRGRQATAVLREPGGRALPPGLRLASADGAVTVQVARDGFAQVQGASSAPAAVEGEAPGATGAAGRRFACDLPGAPEGEILPDLGEVTCR